MTAWQLAVAIATGILVGRTLSVLVVDAAHRAIGASYSPNQEVRFLGLRLRKARAGE